MPRIRTIKPEFFTSLTIADLTPEQRLTFIGLWTHVDDEGRCVDDARLIKAAIWPIDDRTAADVEIDIKALGAADLIQRYVCRNKRYLAVTNWHEHQKINRPSVSKFPAPEDGEPLPPDPSASRSTHGGFSEGSNAASAPMEDGSQTAPAGGFRGGASNQTGSSAFDDALWALDGAMTSEDAWRDRDSLRTHAQLSEDSLQERKGKEGNREGKGTPPTPRESSGSPAVVQVDEGDIADRMADDFMDRYRQGNSYRRYQIRKTAVEALDNGADPDELWRALKRIGSLSKPVTAGTLQFAFSEIRSQQADNVVQMRPSTADQRVAVGQALADKFREEERRALEAGHTDQEPA